MASLLSYAAAFLSLVPTTIATPCANTTAIPLPVPEGPYASSITVQTLTDTSRLNPFNVTDAASPYRQLVVSYYEPYLKEDCASIGEMDYMPEAVAEWFNAADLPVPGMTTFSQLKLSGICLEPPASTPKTPLLLWTGGFYTSRLQYGAIAQAISSWGYRVVTIDHPYDASVIEFPDGSLFLQSIRVQDIAYVASVFGQPDEKIGFYGHSLGASSQTAVLQNDTTGTFVAGLNLDAKLQYPSGPLGLGGADSPAKTYMFIAHDNNTIASEPSWVAFWNTTNLLTPEDPRLAIEIPGTIHNSFTDLPFVVDAAGIRGVNESYFTTLIDTKSGQRELHDITSYAREFFDWTMKGNTTHPLLNGPSEEFTDVLYVKREGF